MSATLAYDRNFLRTTARESALQHQPGHGRNAFVGLSPFDVPDAVRIEAATNNTCKIHFEYADNERVGQTAAGSSDGTIVVLLGQHSGKVLEIHVSNVLQWIEDDGILLEASAIADWVGRLPRQAQATALRNAFLVQRLLAQMPSELRTEIARFVRDDASPGPPSER